MHSHTTNHFENQKHPLSSDKSSELVYEFISETTRFNKKTGKLEYFVQFSKKGCFEIDGRTFTGYWINRKNLWKSQS